ncbi:2045_t:CDS:2, partial [Gigaspora rosea]
MRYFSQAVRKGITFSRFNSADTTKMVEYECKAFELCKEICCKILYQTGWTFDPVESQKRYELFETFEGYLEAINCEIYMNKLADSIINEKLIILKTNNDSEEHENSSKIKNVSTELINHLRCLKLFAHETAYSKRIEFISFISNFRDKMDQMEILSKNVTNTKEEINKRVRILSKCFHPDRTKNQDCPFVLQEIYKNQGDELLKLILDSKEHLLNKLKKNLELENHENHGNELWKITIDYHNASKGQWNKLKQNSMLMGEMAYCQYRAACKIADKAKMLKRKAKLRGYMALCLYFTKKFLEAQLYALAAILLQIRDSTITHQELNEAKKIFDKVNGRIKEKEKSEEGMSADLYTTNNLLINAGRSLVRYQASYKETLRTKKLANSYMVAGAVCRVGGIYFGKHLFKKGKEMFKEPIIREKLNKIINKALSAYDDEKYQKFINSLSEEYDENHKPLFYCRDNIGITGIEEIVNTLQIHGFRSDGIAYLLVVLGEVLASGKIRINGVTNAILKVYAKKIFQMALDDKLVKEARELDECTRELRKTVKEAMKDILKDSILLTERTLEYLDDSQEMPFFSRLEEMRNIARINIAILNILEHDCEAYKMAKETIEEVQKSVKENFQFVSKPELRLEVLEDFLRIISGEDLPDRNTSFFITFPVATKSTSENYLNHQQSFNQNKCYKAVFFERLAEKEIKINKLNSLRHWQSAQENYNIAHEIDPNNPIYSLGYARCLLKLSKYTQVIKLSDTYPGLNSLSEYWHLRS